MSFLRKMFSGKVSSEDPRRFLVESMLGAMEADGDVTEDEMATFEGSLASHPLFQGLSGDEVGRLTELAADAIRVAGGGKARLPAIAQGLPSRNQRLAAYALAAEICVADRDLARGLASYGFTVVSGLARGIDGMAHESALHSGGRTVAVLGSGVERAYPPEHDNLYHRIAE